MKKMGRPSRKGFASFVMLEEPSGNILFFKIDKNGNSSYAGDHNKLIQQASFQHNPQVEQPQTTTNPFNEDQNNIQQNKKSNNKKKLVESNIKMQKHSGNIDNLDLFIDKLDKNVCMSDFLTNHRLSNHMLPINKE